MIIDKAVGNEVFLQNNFLSIGLNGSGTLGTRANAPDGVYTADHIGYTRLGLFADLDGFGVNAKSLLSDAMLEGSPVEGFSIGYSRAGKSVVYTNHERTGAAEIAGTSVDLSTATVAKAGWSGSTSEGLKVSQSVTMTDGGKYARVDIVLTNLTGASISDVRYMRTIDPDQGADFSTTNRIVSQGGGSALIAAYAAGNKTPFFYYSTDSRAVVSTYGFDNRDPYADAAFANAQAVGYTLKGDKAVNITFDAGTLNAGASTTMTFYMGVTDDLDATVAAIGTAKPVNVAPVATDDVFTFVGGTSFAGNLLANDRDADGGILKASLKSGPANGTLTLEADGSFRYVPKAGFVGVDTFTYVASDGLAGSAATAKLVVAAPSPPPAYVTDPLFTRAATIDLTAVANQTVSGKVGGNGFFLDTAQVTGRDKITNFEHEDVLLTTGALAEKAGIVTLKNGSIATDAIGTDVLTLTSVAKLRALGLSDTGLHVYADADTRPLSAIEGKLSDDKLVGDAADTKAQTFFFDTALGLDLGADQIVNFGSHDVFVTTSALADGNGDGIIKFGSDRVLDLPGGAGGIVALTDTNGVAINALELDGVVTHDGSSYYVYSVIGSAGSLESLRF